MSTTQLTFKEKKPPCYHEGNDCPDRNPGCHSHCTKYIEWKAAHEARKDEIARRNFLEAQVRNYNVERTIKSKEDWRRGKTKR